MTGRSTAEDRIALALLALLTVAAFANVVFGGKSLIPSENANPLDPRVSLRNSGPDPVQPEEWMSRNVVPYANYRDAAAGTMQMEPAHELLRRALRRGEFPLWDPGAAGGTASHAVMTGAYLFPPSLVVILFGNGSLVRNVYILLLIFSSGVFTYFLLRRLALRWQAALLGAIAFAFSGAVVQTTPSNIGQCVPFFSLALLFTIRLIELPSMRRAAQLALVFALVASTSFPPLLLQLFGMCALYALLKARGKALAWFAAGAALSLAITAAVYLPAVRLMQQSPHVRDYYNSAAQDVLDPRYVMQLLGPTVMGGAFIYIQPAVMGPTSWHLYYTGVVALFLAGIGILVKATPATRTLKLTVTLFGGLAMLKMFGVQPVQWIVEHAPFLRTTHYAAYFGVSVCYAVAILAALALDALLDGRVRRWQIAASGTIVFLALATLRFFAYRRLVHVHPDGWRWIADFRLIVLFALLAFALAFFTRREWAKALIVAVIAVEAVTNSYFPRVRRWNVWEHPPRYIEVLDALHTGGRVLPMPVYPANTPGVFGHRTLDSLYAFSSPRIHDFYRRYFSSGTALLLRDTVRIPEERVLDVANIEFLTIGGSNPTALAEATRRGYRVVYSDSIVQLMRRPTEPRYFVTTDYQLVPDSEAAREAIVSSRRGTVLVEERPSFAPHAGPLGRVRVKQFGLNEETLLVDAPEAALLVCSESNMDGWTAAVDRKPAKIIAANYAFRAVEVPRGAHEVRLVYGAPGFRSGVALSALGLLLAGAGLLKRERAQG